MAKGAAGISYISAECPDVRNYYMLGDAGAVTLTGVMLNGAGDQKWISVSLTIPVKSATITSPVNLGTLIAAFLLAASASNQSLDDFCGFVGNLTGGIRWTSIDPRQTSAALTILSNDFRDNPDRYPLLAAGNSLRFGSVAVV